MFKGLNFQEETRHPYFNRMDSPFPNATLAAGLLFAGNRDILLFLS